MLALNQALFTRGDRVLVALSGGVDSLALLHLLAGRREAWGIELVAAHVHHGMRGAEADADVGFLRERCAEWGVPLAVEYADVPALAAEQRVSVEVAGRTARYAAFEKLAAERRCGKVATAHHADDQVETILLHLFRGAGIDGLAGMPERRPLSPSAGSPELIRPLLGVRRAELEAYCATHGLEPRFDVTNLDLEYRRNRIRRHLLPLLTEYDPALAPHLLRLAAQAREEQALLGEAVEALLADARVTEPARKWPVPLPPPPPEEVLRRDVLAAAPPALVRRALRTVLRKVAGYALELDATLVERVRELLSESGPTAIDLPGCDFEARRVGEWLVVRGRWEPRIPASAPVELPGTGDFPDFGLRLESREVPLPSDLRLPADQAILDADALRPPFLLRTASVGERFRPLNAPGRRLLRDFYTDRGVPAHYRAVWPVLADAEGPVWVVGLGIAHRVRVAPETRRALGVTVRELPEPK